MASSAENVSIWWRHHEFDRLLVVSLNKLLNKQSSDIRRLVRSKFWNRKYFNVWHHHENVRIWKHFRVIGPMWGESTNHQWLILRDFYKARAFIFLCMNKRLNKQRSWRSPVNSPHNRQWRGALMFSMICAWINGWVNNHEAGDLGRNRAHYDVTVMQWGLNQQTCVWPVDGTLEPPMWNDWFPAGVMYIHMCLSS